MPIVCEFFGIKIYMYWDDHAPPHFHVEYDEHKAIISINDAVVIKGQLPGKPLKLVLAWCELHREELLSNWNSAKTHGEIKRINPLQ